jgi:hypothetical protein
VPGDQSAIDRALRFLGERLEFAGAPLTVLLVGGGAGLNILGLVLRTTKDVDVIALVLGESDASSPVLAKADPLPFYQIHLELYAAVDQGGGRHLTDLLALRPTSDEPLTAARWTKTHDPSSGFNQELVHLLTEMGYGDVARQL